MPYAMPSPPSPDMPIHDLPPLKLRPKHRRTRSATPTFTDERGQGAFEPLPIPRRKPSRAQFHFDDDQNSEESSDETVSSNSLGLTVDTRNVPSNVPTEYLHTQTANKQTSSLPFPSRGSPLPSPRAPSPPQSGSPLQRTPSTPIILSNGKPLKPSLKSSQSSPHIPELRIHSRAQSEPSTPAGGPPKNVHFAEKDALQMVRLFNSSGKPVSVSRTAAAAAAADETETETEYDSSNATSEMRGYPFPSLANLTFEVDKDKSSPIPPPNPPEYTNVHLETLNLPSSGPPMLRGSILVRNLSYSKDVAVRFTLDDWQTTSEVACKHVASLPSLPPPFNTPSTHGDHAASSLTVNTWDRFTYIIRLEDFERKLAEKTIWLVVRYTAPGTGEWWDNNSGQNYRVCFRPLAGSKDGASAAAASDPARFSPVMGNSQQRTFSAPPTLKGTPTTEAVQAVANAQPPSAAKLSIPTSFALGSSRRHASAPPRPSPIPRSNSSPQVSSMTSGGSMGSPSYMRASVPTKLNLLNYAAPMRSSTSASTPTASSPQTDYRNVTNSSSSSRDSPVMHMGMINGMPATGAPQYEYSWPPSNNSSSQSLASPPSPPPSYSAFSLPAPTPNPSDTEKPQRAKESSSNSSLPSDSSYAAFVQRWCFAQSPTPSPGVHMSTESRDVGVNGLGSAHVRQRLGAGGANDWPGMETFTGLYTGRSDSPMLAG